MADPIFGLTPITAGTALAPTPTTTGTGLTSAQALTDAKSKTQTSIYATGATDTQILTADSTQPAGLKWAPPAASTLTFLSGVIPSNVALPANSGIGVLTTASFAVGTWLVSIAASITNGGAIGGIVVIDLISNTATATFAGPAGGESELPALTGGAVNLAAAAIVTVTVAGTLFIRAFSAVAGTILATPTVGFTDSITGYSAVKIA